MGIKDRLAGVVGLVGIRDAAAPRYRAIAPGVVVTDTAAWAWFEIVPTNSDLKPEAQRDIEEDRAEDALRALKGRDAHLKIVWGRISGGAYLSGLALDEATPVQREWASVRADNIDELNVPSKRVLLGVKVRDREQRGQTGEYLGLSAGRVTSGELAGYSAQAVQIGQALKATVWRVQLASSEVLAWSIAREMHRDTTIPLEDTIEGAPLARLTSGRVEPYSDHLEILDTAGEPITFVAILALTNFPEVMVTPGQEWLALLNRLETAPLDLPGQVGQPVPVMAEASVRFHVPTAAKARKTVEEVHDRAKEQIRSAAKHSAGEPDETILLAREETADLRLRLARGHTMLVQDHPRIVLSAPTRAELDAKIVATCAAYDDMGITATLAVDEQRELWLEMLPGDRVRVPDLGHVRDATAFAQSWFWGGSRVGSTKPTIPAVGFTTGSTQQVVRFLATESVSASDAPVTVFLGRTRRGKTTALQLCLLDVALAPQNRELAPWCVLIDTKGDSGGLVPAARYYGIDADPLSVGPQHAGVFDPFVTSDPEHVVDTVIAQLSMLLPGNLAEAGASLVQRASSMIFHNEADPRSYKVVDHLEELAKASKQGSLTEDVGLTLAAAARSGFGRLIAGRPDGRSKGLPARPGVTVIQIPGLNLPNPEDAASTWNAAQRTSVAALRGVLGWCTTMAGSIEMRRRAKVIAVPEVHILTANSDGRTYLTHTARMGAALGVSLLLDTQDVSGIASMTGLAEGIAAVFGFAQKTEAEQDQLAKMIGLTPGPEARAVIDGLDKPTAEDVLRHGDNDDVRRGHCLYRDRRGDVATMQWVLPSAELRAMLDTSATATADREQSRAEQEGAA